RLALEAGAAVMVTSHLGRPTEGEFKPEDSLAPVASCGTLRSARMNTRRPASGTSLMRRKRLTAATLTWPASARRWCRACGWRSPTRCRTTPAPSPTGR
ncbi:MAG: hypothetical protein EBV57_05255, partial [Betaproteobacteria bacterium]|nr:hypothetical protein [Betaproteobacteria bacterium]